MLCSFIYSAENSAIFGENVRLVAFLLNKYKNKIVYTLSVEKALFPEKLIIVDE